MDQQPEPVRREDHGLGQGSAFITWALSSLALLAMTVWGLTVGSWPLIASRATAPVFYLDLQTTLAQSQCWLSGYSGAPYESCGIPLPAGPYNYPPAAFLVAAGLRLTLDDLTTVGAALAMLWTVSAIAFLWAVSRRFSWLAVVFTSVVLASPGASLMLERGSNESLVWILCAGAMTAFWFGRWWLPGLFVSLGILFKFFPLGLAAMFLMPRTKQGWKDSRWVIVLPIVAASATMPFIVWQSGRVPRPIGDAFGAVTFVHFFQAALAWLFGDSSLLDYPESRVTTLAVAASGLVFIGLVSVLWAVLRSWTWKMRPSDARESSIVPSAATIVLVYLSGTNYDYRLAILAFAVAPLWLIMSRQEDRAPRAFTAAVLVALVAGTWLSLPWPRLVQVAGDLCLLVGVLGLAVLCLLMISAAGSHLPARKPT